MHAITGLQQPGDISGSYKTSNSTTNEQSVRTISATSADLRPFDSSSTCCRCRWQLGSSVPGPVRCSAGLGRRRPSKRDLWNEAHLVEMGTEIHGTATVGLGLIADHWHTHTHVCNKVYILAQHITNNFSKQSTVYSHV